MSVKIASIFFYPVMAERPFFQPQPKYVLPAAKRGKEPILFEVQDQREWIEMPVTHQKTERVVPALEVASDLVAIWTGNAPFMSDTQHPGIWILDPQKIDLQVKRAEAAQIPYANALVDEARRLFHAKDRGKDPITPLMRAAAEWLGLEGEDWQGTVDPRARKACPLCTAQIPVNAVVCPKCSNPVDVARFAEHRRTLDAALAGK